MQQRPYGTWASPITAQMMTSGLVGFSELRVVDGRLVWLEGRPHEGGRNVLVVESESGPVDLSPAPYNVRSRVHEYGGGAYCIAGDRAFFVNAVDQNIYCVPLDGGEPKAVTSGDDTERFADLAWDAARSRLIAVRESHSAESEAVNDLVAVHANGGVVALHSGHDFYSSARLAPGGERLAFLAWDHPNMPWDGTQLFVAALDADGALQQPTVVAGGADESVYQPEWVSADRLVFAADTNGYWNLYSYDDSGVYCVAEEAAEFGAAQWSFGMRSFVPAGDRFVVANRIEAGTAQLVIVDLDNGIVSPINDAFSSYGSLTAVDSGVAFIGGRIDAFAAIVRLDLATRETTVVHEQASSQVDQSYFSSPEHLEFPAADGAHAFANFYRPRNPDFEAQSGESPPLLVMSHGGPTSHAGRDLSLRTQYYTSRGWAVLDVDYGGSTGYGRAYRERLARQWGIVDVQDCVAGVQHLIVANEIDPSRVAIRGGSAGGYTTLQALTTSKVFRAGASHYGIGDLHALMRDTHKFESRYCDGLIGDEADARSPINHVEGLDCPVIFFQGEDDRVVPKNQAEAMVEALDAKGLAVGYLLFEGEGHGFRRAENIRQAVEAEYLFFARTFGFEPADDLSAAFDGAIVKNASWQ